MIVCVTLGKRGVVALADGKQLVVEGRAVEAIDTTGAGDCFVGAVAAQLAAGKSIRDAFDYANVAASICVQRMGAAPSMPTITEVATVLSTRRPVHNPWRRLLPKVFAPVPKTRILGVWVPAFAGTTKCGNYPNAAFRSKPVSIACSGVIEPFAASSLRPNM